MAKLSTMIKKAEQLSGSEIMKAGQKFYVDYKGYRISFFQNGDGDQATNYYVLKHGREDDLMSDYWAGTFLSNLKQCFDFVDRATAAS